MTDTKCSIGYAATVPITIERFPEHAVTTHNVQLKIRIYVLDDGRKRSVVTKGGKQCCVLHHPKLVAHARRVQRALSAQAGLRLRLPWVKEVTSE